MNFRQGFFRIWVVVTLAFMATVGAFSYEKVQGEFEKAGQDWSKEGILLVPVLCRDARGVPKVDYELPAGPWTDYTTAVGQCWYKIDAIRRLYPEYKDVSEDDLSNKLYKKAGIVLNPARPWSTLGWAILVALGIPVCVLILGAALGWAIGGFFTSRANK